MYLAPCGQLTAPANGHVEIFARAIITCDDGFTLNTTGRQSEKLFCSDKTCEWSSEIPSCFVRK